ncbi:MAG: methyltransferase domain-containing protein [Cyclobacteriaceae bacterium]|nr:methyltransferase domain-containing protein [Cyclobacteriaceae bacterium]
MDKTKPIRRDSANTRIFDERSLETDYRTLKPLLKKGWRVLDVGCGTGAISRDIAACVGPSGSVTGIDNTEKFILSGRESYGDVPNLELQSIDLFDYEAAEPFDLVVSARVLQWLHNPAAAIQKMKSLLRPGGIISILDYDHTSLEWVPDPPESMRQFYAVFLKWRADAGMDNRMAENLPALLKEAGFQSIEKINSDEHYHRGRPDYLSKAGIWAKVAGLKQIVEEGYLPETLRLKAIADYTEWVDKTSVSMTMKLNDVRGIKEVQGDNQSRA